MRARFLIEGARLYSHPAIRAAFERLTRDPDPQVRIEAGAQLRDRAGPGAHLVAQLGDDLMAKAAHRRVDAVKRLKSLGPGAAPAVAGLLQMLESEDAELRSEAIDVLCEATPGMVLAATAVPVLLRSLERTADTDLHGLECHALALLAYGAAAAPATAALVRVLRPEQPLARNEDDKEELRTLGSRCAAASALRAIGPGARDAVPALIQVLEHEGYRLRKPPTPGLPQDDWHARPHPFPVHGDMDHRPRLTHRTLHLAPLCCEALAAIGPAARAAIPVLEQRARDGQGFGTRAAAQAALLSLRGK